MNPSAPFVLAIVVKATLLLLAAGVLALLLRRASAAVRHLIWAAALGGTLALPLLAAVLPRLPVPLPALATRRFTAVPRAEALLSAFPPAAVSESRSAVRTPPERAVAEARIAPTGAAAAPARSSGGALLLGVWFCGAAALLLRLALGRLGTRRLARRAESVTDPAWTDALRDATWLLDVHRPVALLRSGAAAMPMTWGTRRPVVLLPAGADGWPAGRRRSTLLHEIAHVARRDCLSQTLAELACALYWFHPGVWYAARRLRAERERACDDRVLAAGESAPAYAAHLLEVARMFRSDRLLAPVALAMARPSQLEGRLLAILDTARSRRAPGPRLLAAAAALALLLLLPLAAAREVAAAQGAAAPADGSEPFRWSGTIPRGQTLEVRGVIGPITATRAAGNEAEVVAVRRAGDRGDPERIRFETVRHAGGITICALYPSRRADRPNRCTPGGNRNGMSVDNFDAAVHWTVRVPAGVGFSASTIDGDVRATGLASDVRAATVDGDVQVTTTGSVTAATVDGDVTGELSRVTGPLSFTTVDGDIALTLPAGADARISASTLDGEIVADFPLARERGRWVGRSATATLGRGGPAISLKTVAGTIRLRGGRGGVLRSVPAPRRPEAAPPAPAPAAPPVAPVSPAPAPAPSPPPPADPEWEAGFAGDVQALVEASVATALHATSAALAAVDAEQIRRDVQREIREESRRGLVERRGEARRDAVLEVIRSARETSAPDERAALLAWAAAQPEMGDPAVRAAWDRAAERLSADERRRMRTPRAEPGR